MLINLIRRLITPRPSKHGAVPAAAVEPGKPGLRFDEPAHLAAHVETLLKQGDRARAMAALERAAAVGGVSLSATQSLASIFEQAGDLDAADSYCRRALALFPDDPQLLHIHANVLVDMERWSEARDRYEAALALDPDSVSLRFNLANLMQEMGEIPRAVAGFERVLEMVPAFTKARMNLAVTRLASGDLARGWSDYEFRFDEGVGEDRAQLRPFDMPRWRGEELRGKRLLVWGEQGIGDQMIFASLYPELAERAGECIIECSPKLVPLFEASFAGVRVVPQIDPPHPVTRENIDFQIPCGSLGRLLRPTTEAFPSRASYFRALPSRVEVWRQWLNALGPALKIGICWRSKVSKGARAQACTDIAQWVRVLGVRNVTFVNLQYDQCAEELERAHRLFNVTIHGAPGVDLFDDLLETSALMSALDLVISAPTVVSVHAAALGVPTWQLTCGTDWQTLGTQANPWLPRLTRYHRDYRQDWPTILDRVAQDLARTASSHDAHR